MSPLTVMSEQRIAKITSDTMDYKTWRSFENSWRNLTFIVSLKRCVTCLTINKQLILIKQRVAEDCLWKEISSQHRIRHLDLTEYIFRLQSRHHQLCEVHEV